MLIAAQLRPDAAQPLENLAGCRVNRVSRGPSGRFCNPIGVPNMSAERVAGFEPIANRLLVRAAQGSVNLTSDMLTLGPPRTL